MAITNGSTSCRVSCQITTRASIGLSACDPRNFRDRRKKLLDTVYSAIKIAGPSKFKVGNSVRVNKYKTIFEKDYTPNGWTTKVFTIMKVQRTIPVTYLLKDYSGKSVEAFYEHESRYSSGHVSRGESIAPGRK